MPSSASRPLNGGGHVSSDYGTTGSDGERSDGERSDGQRSASDGVADLPDSRDEPGVDIDDGVDEWTQAEFCAYMSHFADMDSDGDGFITAEDILAFATCLGGDLTDKQVWDLIDDKDEDGDGRVGCCSPVLQDRQRQCHFVRF